MREKIYRGDVSHRSPPQSPSRSRVRNREYSPPRREIGERRTTSRFDRSLGSVANESQRSRRIDHGSGSSARRDYDSEYYDDGDRDVQSRRLSEFNEGLSRVESTAMKFQWKQLLSEPNKFSNESSDVDRSLNRSIDGYVVNRGGSEKNYPDIRYSDRNQAYQGIRYSDTNPKSYEDIRTNQKSYEDVRNSDTSWSGMLFEKPFSMEAGRAKSYSFYSPDVGVSKGSGHLDDGFTLPSLNLNLGLHEDEPYDSRLQLRPEKLQGDKSPTRPTREYYKEEYYKEEGNSMVYSKEVLDYKLPFSGSKAIGKKSLGLLKEDFPSSFKGYGLSSKTNTRPLGHDGYRQQSRSKSPVELYDRRDYNRSYCSPTDEEHGDYYNYLDGHRSVRGHTGTMSKEFRGTMLTIGEKYGRQDLSRTGVVDPIVDRLEECSHREKLGDRRLWDHSPSSEGKESPNYLKASGSLRVRKQKKEVLGFGSTHREYKRDVYEDHGSLLSGESDAYERDDDPWTHEDSCENLSMAEYDPYLDDAMGGSSRTILKRKRGVDEKSSMLNFGSKISGTGKSTRRIHDDGVDEMDGSSGTILRSKHGVDEKSSMLLKFGGKISSTGKSTRRIHDDGVADEGVPEKGRTGEDRKLLLLSKKSRLSHSKYGKTGSASNETAGRGTPKADHLSTSGTGPISPIPRHLSKPHSSSRGRDIKNRLGPCPQNTHDSHSSLKDGKSLLKNRLGPRLNDFNSSLKNGKSLLKKRLGPRPQKFRVPRVPLPWLNFYGFNQQRRLARKNQVDDVGGDGDPLEGNLTIEKAEPPENSEEFAQMVQHAFFRFVKQLNENASQRRRYMEQGEGGTLKCSICGSESEEFLDTETLVVHAFTSPKVGCRSQHLGFHKALCVLMGWKSKVGAGSPWVHEILSDAETLAIKEDLVIWPPVVIIHNSSLGNKYPDERVIVSIEVLESVLKEMGYGEKTKVCRGKPANESIMLVKFNATFSGLQEAERLHSFYIESKHGRAEFQHFEATGEPPESAAPAGKVEHALYGHLGLAEDLDKLDFETKKRCLVKSKREIQNIADAPLKAAQ